MKKRRTAIVAFLLIAAMTIGVGYAALTDTLKVTGTAGIAADDVTEAFEEDIYFSKALANPTYVDAQIDGTDKDLATMTVLSDAFTQVGDERIATFTIKSDSDLPVAITAIVTGTGADAAAQETALNATYFTVTHNLPADYVLAAGSTVDVTVTVRLAKTPLTAQNTSFTVTFNATAQNA